MKETSNTLDEFVSEVRESELNRDSDDPLYTLILGAGASRSAGIPVAWEMEGALRKLARIRGISLAGKPKAESKLSWFFRRVFDAPPADDDYVSTGRQFLLSCVRRSEREANLTHLVAAHLSTMGVFNPIVTTNFDDQALAGFWSLPWSSADSEPHLMYSPASDASSSPDIAAGVPIIIKAHGHHTTYGMRMLDEEIDSISTSVASLMGRLAPSRGFVVVGYSGGSDDGVVQALAQAMPGKRIYWLYRGERPAGRNIERICASNAVRFVPIVDADLAFLRLWFALPTEAEVLSKDGLTQEDLIVSFRPGWRPNRGTHSSSSRPYDWFNPNLVSDGDHGWRLQDPEKFERARAELLPILNRIEALDDWGLYGDCIGQPSNGEAIDDQVVRLSALVPMDFEWTRRNRRILKLGLMMKPRVASR